MLKSTSINLHSSPRLVTTGLDPSRSLSIRTTDENSQTRTARLKSHFFCPRLPPIPSKNLDNPSSSAPEKGSTCIPTQAANLTVLLDRAVSHCVIRGCLLLRCNPAPCTQASKRSLQYRSLTLARSLLTDPLRNHLSRCRRLSRRSLSVSRRDRTAISRQLGLEKSSIPVLCSWCLLFC